MASVKRSLLFNILKIHGFVFWSLLPLAFAVVDSILSNFVGSFVFLFAFVAIIVHCSVHNVYVLMKLSSTMRKYNEFVIINGFCVIIFFYYKDELDT